MPREKELGQYSAVLTGQAWSIKDLLHGKRMWDIAQNTEQAR